MKLAKFPRNAAFHFTIYFKVIQLLIVHCAGDITDLFDAFDGFNDSAYHAYIGMVQEEEYMEDGEGEAEDEDIAYIVAADNYDEGSNSSSNRSSDSCSDAGNSADPQMVGDSASPGYSTMYAQLYTDECVNTGNKCAVVTIITIYLTSTLWHSH